MCEYTDKEHRKKGLKFLRNNHPQNILNTHIKRRFPYSLRRGCCPVCGYHLSHLERWPPGRASRSMCVSCYEELIVNRINHNCFVCGRPLSNRKIKKQMNNPREIQFHIEDGYCENLWTIIHNIAVGEPEFVDVTPRTKNISFTPKSIQLKQNDDGILIPLDSGMKNILGHQSHKGKPIKVI